MRNPPGGLYGVKSRNEEGVVVVQLYVSRYSDRCHHKPKRVEVYIEIIIY